MPRVLVFNGTDPATDDQPYGAEALREHGYVLAAGPRARYLPAKVRDAIHHRYDVQVDRPGLRAARHADLVLAYLEPNISYPALMKRLPFSPYRRPPLVSLFCWAAEDLMHGSPTRRERVLRMLDASDLVAFFSSNQEQIFLDAGVSPAKLLTLPFGVDTGRLGAAEGERDIEVLSVGWDRGRDYPTLVEAVRGTGLHVEVVAKHGDLVDLHLPPNVVARGTVPLEEYHDLLHRSRVVVVPTHELAYPTGQSVALEAAAAGCAVVVTDTPAMRDYFTQDVTALMPAPSDVRDLRQALLALTSDHRHRDVVARAGQAHVHRCHSYARLWSVLVDAVADRRLSGDRT